MVVLSVSCLGQTYFVQGPAEPKPYEQTAIRELADYLARRINGTLSIGGHSPVTLQVGDTDLAREQHCLSTELEDERWVIRSVGDQVLLNGGGTRGALYAVYHFLEDHCGIHWWSDFEDDVPEASPLALEALDATGKPAFAYRDIYRTHRRGIGPLTALRNRLNRDGDEPIPMALGGSFTYGSPEHVHTFDKYVPFAEFGSSHPEYFSLRGGQRVGGQTAGQLCLTNPELKNLILKRMLAYIEADQKDAAEHGKPMPRIYDLSMNDNLFPCECEACKAEAEKYNPSGFYLNFVNSIAREVGKSHPEVFISTLAYYFTEEPPKQGVRAEDNVIVKLCDTKTNEAASILEPDNRVMLDFLRQWQNHAKNLFVWDYAIVFTVTGFPFASEFTYGELYRTYHENNVTGIFWEHEYPFEADFYELKYFLEAKLAEDPEQDADALMRLFMDRYYQEAGPFLLSYRRLLDQQRKARQGYISWFPPASAFFHLSNHALKECQALFDQAEAAVAAKPRIWARVRHARAGLDRLTCVKKASAPIFHGAAAGNAES
ncbi:MAG: DUF4838 domain-containing protein, partial [Victivallales bacterium]|nr:DUF4838 domain-containing protein [Victivallales bacterium]